jgi:hypothetical protein
MHRAYLNWIMTSCSTNSSIACSTLLCTLRTDCPVSKPGNRPNSAGCRFWRLGTSWCQPLVPDNGCWPGFRLICVGNPGRNQAGNYVVKFCTLDCESTSRPASCQWPEEGQGQSHGVNKLIVASARDGALSPVPVLYCTVLYCTVLYCTVLYCTVMFCDVLYYAVLHHTTLHRTVLYCTELR